MGDMPRRLLPVLPVLPVLRLLPLLALLFLLFLLLPPIGDAAGPGEPPVVREDPRAEFAALCQARRSGDHPYFGAAPLADLERRLDLPGASPEVQAGVRGRLGQTLLRLGHPAEAVARFEQALAIAEAAELSSALRRQIERDLALALIQLGEDENCVLRHRATSCILPIAPEAVHTAPSAVRRAGDLYLKLATADPGDVQMRWLLVLARMISGDDPAGIPEALRLPSGAFASEAPFPRFSDIAAELGVDVLDLSGGAAMDDFDGDGLLDLITSTWDACDGMKAFRNNGDGTFTNVTVAWGLDEQYGGLNLVHGDYDGDGDLDLFVLRGAWQGEWGEIRNSLLKNDLRGEAGRFLDVTRAAGVAHPFPTQNAAFADYDGDGDLDLHVGAEATPDHPYPGRLYRNNGDGTFTDVAPAAGVTNLRFAKAGAWGDFDDDGDPDLYVSNFGPNRLYRNNGDGTFTDIAAEAGVTGPEVSFATWFFDFDNDGDLDLFVADYGSPYARVSASYLGLATEGGNPRLYRNDGRGHFTDISRQVGLTRPLLPMGANYGDLDNDGFLDIYLGTGVPDLEAVMPNVMYRNAGGRRFEDITFAGGFGHLQKGHGIAFGDLDHDGDQDLFEQMGGAWPVDAFFNALYENPTELTEPPPHWLTLHPRGKGANPYAMGGRLEVRVRQGELRRSVHLLIGSGGSFGGSSLEQEVGLGSADAVEAVTLRWPGTGTVQTWTGLDLDSTYLLQEGEAAAIRLDVRPFGLGSGHKDPTSGPHPNHPAASGTIEIDRH